MKTLLHIVLVAAFACVATCAVSAEPEKPESLVAVADRIAVTMMESPPDDLTRAEVALAFGWMHLFGMLGEPGPGRAEEYLEMAIAEGLPEAGVVLGAMYSGHGEVEPAERNVLKAIAYYTAAAEQDCVDALRMLGITYAEGEDGIEPDQEKALDYFLRAATLGSETALAYLEPHFAEAAAWEAEHPGETADFPSSPASVVDPDRAAEAKARSNRMSTITAKVFDLVVDAMTAEDAARLSSAASKALQDGENDIWAKLERAVEEGVEHLLASQPSEAKKGDAALVVGIFHYMGLLNGYDPERAEQYLEMALEKGVPEAGVTLGELYLGITRTDGGDDERDIEKGLSYLQQAADKDNVDALRVLGLVYADGRDGIEPDQEKAERYFRAAARHGDELALARLQANLDIGDIDVSPELAEKAKQRREEIDQMVNQVNAELEQRVLEAMRPGEAPE